MISTIRVLRGTRAADRRNSRLGRVPRFQRVRVGPFSESRWDEMNWLTLTDDELHVALARRLGGSYWGQLDSVLTLIRHRSDRHHHAQLLIEELIGG